MAALQQHARHAAAGSSARQALPLRAAAARAFVPHCRRLPGAPWAPRAAAAAGWHSSSSSDGPQRGAAQAAAAPPAQAAAAPMLVALARNALLGAAAAAACSLVAATLSTGAAGAPLASLSLAASSPAGSAGAEAAKSAWAGLAAGFLHTLCGPDHLAALTPLTIGRNRAAASALGALWGFGHSTGQLILGLVFVVLKDRFHDLVPALSRWSGTVVGLTLIAIGLMGIYETYFEDPAAEEAEESELKLAVAGAGAGGGTASAGSFQAQARMGLATYATGIVYGLHPDALFVVIPALALPTKLAAIAYCTMFVLGTVTAMGGYTLAIGTTSAALTRERPWLQAHLSTLASGVAIAVGVLILLSGFGLQVPLFG